MVEDSVREAIVAEMERQAAARPERLSVSRSDTRLRVEGEVDLEELVMAVIGSVAGGP